MFAGSPSNVATVNPAHSASAASSVKSLRPSRAARRWASRMTSKRNACGVCAMRSRARSGVASTLPVSSTSLMVSVTAIAGTAAPVRPAASIAREISAAVTNGRAASWIRTMSGFWPASASSPACTEACRVAPPLAGGCVAQRADGLVEHRGVVGIENRLHRKDLRMPAKRLHRPEDHGLAADRAILLRSARRRREARARLRQGWLQSAQVSALDSITGDQGDGERWSAGALPLSCRGRKNRTIPNSCGKSIFCCSALARLTELSKV